MEQWPFNKSKLLLTNIILWKYSIHWTRYLSTTHSAFALRKIDNWRRFKSRQRLKIQTLNSSSDTKYMNSDTTFHTVIPITEVSHCQNDLFNLFLSHTQMAAENSYCHKDSHTTVCSFDIYKVQCLQS